MANQTQSGLTQVSEHVWRTDFWLVAMLAVPLEQIATRNDLVLQTWSEEGLGEFTGLWGQLPSGVVIRLEQSAALVSNLEHLGPALFADAADVHLLGIEALITETLSALGLSLSDIEARNEPPSPAEVAGIVRRVDGRRDA